MGYRELWREENQAVMERYKISMERIGEIHTEYSVKPPYLDYFQKVSGFIGMIENLVHKVEKNDWEQDTIEQLKENNDQLFLDITGENYKSSYANPEYCVTMLGEDYGRLLSFLYTEIRGMTAYAYELRLTDITICNEIFIEIYNAFEGEELPQSSSIKDMIYWFVSDYSDITVNYRVRELVDPELDFAKNIIMKSDLKDLRYLYAYGEYIADTELKVADYLNGLSEETIDLMATTYTEGYKKGFELAKIDLSKKKIVVLRYPIGFERMVRKAVIQFEGIGLTSVIYRYALNSVNKSSRGRQGFTGTSVNRQYDFDHRFDHGLYMDKAFKDRKISVFKTAFEQYKELAKGQAGPAVIETFGEAAFDPISKKEVWTLSDKQRKLETAYANESTRILNEYIPGDERSFTIIAFPLPEIGKDFNEIFTETIRINTLDYAMYRDIQQNIIDALDRAQFVQIKGKGSNQTDLNVCLQRLNDKQRESNFENCVADVNIPVGEVFTSPKLAGTSGVLFVEQVYLNEQQFKNLKVVFKDGMITDYDCDNFESKEDNLNLIKNNILYNHPTLPMGEFAIGTNTTAYAVAKKYDIFDKMPILIAEKMGPHFALGDTCYSWSEDNKVYNPDGKEITARDNEISILRKEDITKAYFNCHTDITIPYHELDSIIAVSANGSETAIIMDGKFVLPGTEELNKPLT